MKYANHSLSAELRGALLVAALASVAGAQQQDWVLQIGTAHDDLVKAAAPDGSGGVFLGGYTVRDLGGPNMGSHDAWFARYDGAGNQAWIRQLGSDEAEWTRAVVPDDAGGVFVAGHTGGGLGGPSAGRVDAWLARYDGAGGQLWTRQIGTTSSDYLAAAAPDGSGGVFICGRTPGDFWGPSAGEQDAWLARFDGAGNQLWLRQFGSARNDDATAAASDGVGGVFIVGGSAPTIGGSQQSTWIARYDGAGNQSWVRLYGTTSGDHAEAAAPDGAGGVYVSGYTSGTLGGPNAGSNDAWVARYDSAGNETWIRQFGSPREERVWGASSDGSGGVFVTGDTHGDLAGPSAGDYDAWITHFDPAGIQTWIQQFGTDHHDYGRAVAPDGSGGALLSGDSYGSLGGPRAGRKDVWVARYGHSVAHRYCTPSVQNSTGQGGMLNAIGSDAVLANDVTLVASALPHRSFGYFLTSQVQELVVGSGGSQGDLCVGAPIGRFIGAGQVLSSNERGWFSLVIDLTSIPQPLGSTAVQPGESWNFQAWYRDANPGATTNFTDAVSVTFL